MIYTRFSSSFYEGHINKFITCFNGLIRHYIHCYNYLENDMYYASHFTAVFTTHYELVTFVMMPYECIITAKVWRVKISWMFPFYKITINQICYIKPICRCFLLNLSSNNDSNVYNALWIHYNTGGRWKLKISRIWPN